MKLLKLFIVCYRGSNSAYRITTLPNLSLYESINKSLFVILRKNSVTFVFFPEGLIA